MNKKRLAIMATLWLLLPLCAVGQVSDAVVIYAGPQAAGVADGHSPQSCLALDDPALWSRVGELCHQQAVRVTLLPGHYRIDNIGLDDLGDVQHTITVSGPCSDEQDGQALIERPDSTMGNMADKRCPLQIGNCRNMVFENLHFTGPQPMGHGLHLYHSNDIVVRHCSWVDMPGIIYGAIGTSTGCDNITFSQCTFERIGRNGGSHMIYNAYDCSKIHVLDCRFIDCLGDFVRFRDNTDYCEIINCSFEQTRQLGTGWPAFINFPLFNNDDPDNLVGRPNYEYFGTHYVISNNRFKFPVTDPPQELYPITIRASGFDPPNRQYLFTEAEKEQFLALDTAGQIAWLQQRMGLETDQFQISDNVAANVAGWVQFWSKANYGAEKSGNYVQVLLDITDLFPGLTEHNQIE